MSSMITMLLNNLVFAKSPLVKKIIKEENCWMWLHHNGELITMFARCGVEKGELSRIVMVGVVKAIDGDVKNVRWYRKFMQDGYMLTQDEREKIRLMYDMEEL